MHLVILLWGAVLTTSIGLTVAEVTTQGKDKSNIGQNLRIACTVTGESFQAWKIPSGVRVTTTDKSSILHIEIDGDKRTLVINGVTLEHGGNYECVGSQNTASFLLEIPFTLESNIDKQELHLGKKDTIRLSAHGYPRPLFTWKKDGVVIKPSSSVKFLEEGSLEFQKVVKEDGGIYTYKVSQFSGNLQNDGAITVTIVDKAKIIRKPDPASRRLTKGYNATFTCMATGLPKPQIQWRYENDKELDPFFLKHYTFTEGNWTITGIIPDDKGKYACVAKNSVGTDRAGVEITYVDVPAKIDPSVVDVVKKPGEKAELECKTSEGDPKPTVRWLKNGLPSFLQKYNGDRSESVITFDKVRLRDSGEYVCEARNRALDDKGKEIVAKKTVTLDITSAPVLNEKASPKTVYSFVGNGKPVTVQCMFLGYPAPDVKLIAPNGTVLAKGNYSAAIKVTTKAPTDFSNFTCDANNEEGSETVGIELKMAVAPSKPRDVQFEKTCKRITLIWKVPKADGGMPLTQYTISTVGYTVNVPAGDDEMERELNKDFKPDTSHTVEIFARTEAGRSVSVKVSDKTNKYCVPGKPIITNQETKLKEDEFTLKWDAPDYDGGDSEITYNVEWKDSSDESAQGETKKDIKEKKLKITDLEYNTEYEVKLYAVNQQGPSQPAKKYFKVGKGSGIRPQGPKPTGNSTGQPAVPGQRGGAESVGSSLSNGAIAGIVIAIILIVLIAIDLFCCFFNSCGLFFCCSKTFCGGGGGKGAKSNKYKDSNAAEMEKKSLPENV